METNNVVKMPLATTRHLLHKYHRDQAAAQEAHQAKVRIAQKLATAWMWGFGFGSVAGATSVFLLMKLVVACVK